MLVLLPLRRLNLCMRVCVERAALASERADRDPIG